MAELRLEALEAAYNDSVFDRLEPGYRFYLNQYLPRSIKTAVNILELIRESPDGVEIASIAKRMGLNLNTVKIYCRWLASRQLIEPNNPKKASIYFPK